MQERPATLRACALSQLLPPKAVAVSSTKLMLSWKANPYRISDYFPGHQIYYLEFDRVFRNRFTILVQITSDRMKEDWVCWVNGYTYKTSRTVLLKVPPHLSLSLLTRYKYQSSSDTGSDRLENRPHRWIRSCITCAFPDRTAASQKRNLAKKPMPISVPCDLSRCHNFKQWH